MKRIVLFALFAAVTSCKLDPPTGDDGFDEDPLDAEGEGEGGEGEGELFDGGIPDPDVVGLDERPVNTTCVAQQRPPLGSDVDLVEPWPELQVSFPVFMLQEPGSNRMYVVQRGGRIVRFDKDNAAVTTPQVFADLGNRVKSGTAIGEERGLLGMAFHPQWPTVAEVFVSFSGFGAGGEPDSNRVSRFRLGNDGLLDEDSEEPIFVIADPFGNHNGGMIAFSPTDPCTTCLYISTGDGGSAGDPRETGQDPSTLLAKILRIDVAADDAGSYGIPSDNPFVDDDAFRPETFAFGFRNPWRWSFDRASGDLWVGDVGQGEVEEVDLVRAGGNYGWNIREGTDCFDNDNGDCSLGGLEEPVTQYRHTDGRKSITGGYVYRGSDVPALDGTYLFADYESGEVFALFFDDAGEPAPEVVLEVNHVSSFAEDTAGEVYVIDHALGKIERIVPAGPPVADNFPKLLSQTGCADPADPSRPASGLIPYTVAHPLYSDGAAKERAFALPEGTKATLEADGDIDFPVGTVFRKDFMVDGVRVETRLLMHHDDGDWAGYTYEWNADGTDAELVARAGKTKVLPNGQAWTYPSRNGCLACHTLATRRVLGPELAQLNVGFVYEQTGTLANQLTTLEGIGVFEQSLPAPVTELNALVPLDDQAATAEEKARSYLHVNCSTCHREGGAQAAGDTDMRYTVGTGLLPFEAMALCDRDPTEGDLGVDGAKRLAPGDPGRSLVSIRMKRLGAGRMPQLGSAIVDEPGVAAVDAWISSLGGCP